MAGSVVSNVKKYYGGQVPVPGQGDSDGKVKVLVEKTATMEIGGVRTEVELLFDSDDLTTPVTPQQLGQWTDENYLIAFKTRDGEGVVRGFILYALETDSTSTDTLVNRATFVNFKEDMNDPGASAYVFEMVEDSSTLTRYLRDAEGELIVKFNQATVEAGAQSGTLHELIDTDTWAIYFEVVHEDGKSYLRLNTEGLGEIIDDMNADIEYIIGALDELPSDEHGYFNSSLYATPGDGTTTNIVMDEFRITEGRDVSGENIEFVPTRQEGGVDFGNVYLKPGTYILAIQYTLQWVGNPRGTFLPKVCSVADQPFDFSYEHEDVVRVTRIVTKTTRGKLVTNIPIDADTPPMGVWVKNMEVVQVATFNHSAVAHDTTLTGTGKLDDPLGVNTPDVAQSTLAGNVAPAFVPNSTNALKGRIYIYNGVFYKANDNYSGPWDATKFTIVSIIDVLNSCIRTTSQSLKNKCELFTNGGMTYQSKINLLGTPSSANMLPTGLYDWIAPMKLLFDNVLFGNIYLQYGGFAGSYDPYTPFNTFTRIRTSYIWTGKLGGVFRVGYGASNLTAKYVFYFDVDNGSGRLKYSSNTSVTTVAPTSLRLTANKVACVVFADKDSLITNIESAAFDELSLSYEENAPSDKPILESDLVVFNKVTTALWMQGGIDPTAGGNFSPSSGYYYNRIRTEHMEVLNSSISISFNATDYDLRYFYYNSDKSYIGWGQSTASPVTLSRTVGEFLRLSLIRKNSSQNISPEEGFRNVYSIDGVDLHYVIYEKPLYESSKKFLIGKKVVFIGDSITAGAFASPSSNNYVNQFGAITGATVVNLGVNGTCIANNTKNGLGSSRFVTRATSENLGDADLVVVFGGTNDLAYDSKAIGNHFSETTITASGNIGTKQLGPVSDTDTFAGALHDLIITIQTNVRANTPILFLTPLHRNNNTATNPNSYQCNSNGDFMKDFVDAVKDICGFYAIPVLDMYSDAELNPLVPNYSGLFSDGLHPGNKGHHAIAKRIAEFVKNNITFIT